MMMSFNSNIRNKINSLNNNGTTSSSSTPSSRFDQKSNSTPSKSTTNIKVSNSISEKIKKLSSQNSDTQTGTNATNAISASSSLSTNKSEKPVVVKQQTKTQLVEKKDESLVNKIVHNDPKVVDNADEAKVETKVESNLENKPEINPEINPEIKPEIQPDIKLDIKPEIKPDIKPEIKPHIKPEIKDNVEKNVNEIIKISGELVKLQPVEDKPKVSEAKVTVKQEEKVEVKVKDTNDEKEKNVAKKNHVEDKSQMKLKESAEVVKITKTTEEKSIAKPVEPKSWPKSKDLEISMKAKDKVVENISKPKEPELKPVVVKTADVELKKPDEKKSSKKVVEKTVENAVLDSQPNKPAENGNTSCQQVLQTSEDVHNRSEPSPNKLINNDSTSENSSSNQNTTVSGEQSPILAEEEDSVVSSSSTTAAPQSQQKQKQSISFSANHFMQLSSHMIGADFDDPDWCKRKLAEAQFVNQQLKLENEHLHDELQAIRHEMEELQDQFRLDDADEFRQLQAELEIAAKNCRILQFKLRKLEKRNENLENEKILFQDKLDDLSREANRIIDLEEELLIAKEVSIRLHGELEQAQEWRTSTDLLNKELKKQLDDLKDYLDNEIKNRNSTEDYSELVLVNKLYESMFREYFLQEQLYTLSNSAQSQNVSKQLREVTELLNSYQQKISLLNEEIDLLKQQVTNKDKELEQYRIQLKNLKRSRSSDTYERNNRRQVVENSNAVLTGKSNSSTSIEQSSSSSSNNNSSSSNSSSDTVPATIVEGDVAAHHNVVVEKKKEGKMSASSDNNLSQPSDMTLSRQLDCANDEIKLLRNKIARLEDDLLSATQERDSFSLQLEKIEDKAMKSFTTLVENEKEVELELDTVVIKQMGELKKKIDQLNFEAKRNEEIKEKLSIEIKELRDQLNGSQKPINPIEEKNMNIAGQEEEDNLKKDDAAISQNNLTDADKLNQDVENIELVKLELADKQSHIARMQLELQSQFSHINELKKLIDIKETSLTEAYAKEVQLSADLESRRVELKGLNDKLEQFESGVKLMKIQLEDKMTLEFELKSENERLETKITTLAQQVHEKASEIEFLNRESNALQERINSDELRCKRYEHEVNELRAKLEHVQSDLEKSKAEISKLEAQSKHPSPHRSWTNSTNVVKMSTRQMEEYERTRKELNDLKERYAELSESLNGKVCALTKEIDRLNKDKEQLSTDLAELRMKYEKAAATPVKKSEANSYMIEQEIDHEKAILEKLEAQAVNTKYEAKIQYLEVEIDTLRSKIRKLLKEKETQDQVLKENQQLVKDIALKYSTDSDLWSRQKQKLLEKEKLYEESVEMRKELKKAADKLRQKLQSLEEQIIDKQNKHTMEKNSWETQRIQFMSVNNKLEEQLSKLSTLKRSKKEIEFAWDKERRDLNAQITNLDTFARDLQNQLAQAKLTATANLNSSGDQYSINERMQSLSGENEFLKNRIRELELMLDELDQVKRFLAESKQAYDSDRMEWEECKRELTDELIHRDVCQREWDGKMGEILRVVRALLNNEAPMLNQQPREESEYDMYEDRDSMASASCVNNGNGGQQESRLSSLVGGTASLLDDAKFSKSTADDLRVIDMSKDQNELDTDFDQAFKKINRVKDNYSTHKKFMDIVKSKSMKALNRKSSITSLPQQNSVDQFDNSRGSMPPEHSSNSKSATQSSSSNRAKSVSKEPDSNSQTMPSRFFSLSRRLGAKIRFSSSSQPPAKANGSNLSAKSATNLTEELKGMETSRLTKGAGNKQMTQSQLLVPTISVEEPSANNNGGAGLVESRVEEKKNLRERALSPSKIFRSLRPRSPFGRTNRNSKVPTATSPTATNTATTIVSGTSGDASGKNKSFTVSSKSTSESSHSTPPTSTGILSRFTRANTALPSTDSTRNGGIGNSSSSSAESKLRSLSCEFIDNNNNNNINGSNNKTQQQLKLLDERDELVSSVDTIGCAGDIGGNGAKARRNLGYSSLNKVDHLRKSFMESTHSSQCSTSDVTGVVKTVKFKDPPENPADDDDDENNGYINRQTDNNSDLPSQPDDYIIPESTDTTTSIQLNSKKPSSQQQQQQQQSRQIMKGSLSSTNVDKPPPSANASTSSTFNFRSRSSANTNTPTTTKSKTIDFPDLLQSAIESGQSQSSKLLTPSGRPIQSILRRSETPPTTKTAGRQTSLDSAESHLSASAAGTRETSIEKLLKTTSTSRPLIFNS